ncbi:hypothetical protein FOL47_005768 [Perkinsus chesapeaki]|uniref:Thymus-specific serine protease n=1 Tax=Perkinsus chesapeaki TaxID=330153 RepID=A0A7J6LVQ5_PERCH|nr:hypothetical protein FOL47_005768 [Perkinsus chesapeaki]
MEAGIFAQQYKQSFDFYDKRKPIFLVRITVVGLDRAQICDIFEPADQIKAAMVVMENSGSPLDKLADIFNTNNPVPPGECKGDKVKAYINRMKSSKVRSAERMDLFYICGNRALLPACERGTCPFYTNTNWAAFWLMVCQEGFGLSKDKIRRNVKHLREYVGEDLHGAKNILLINGVADPWYPSGITKERPGTQVIKTRHIAFGAGCRSHISHSV